MITYDIYLRKNFEPFERMLNVDKFKQMYVFKGI